jgi:hypothetical protein
MVAHVATVAFNGVETTEVDVQVQIAPGLPAFTIVGLPDKAVAESRESGRRCTRSGCPCRRRRSSSISPPPIS